jgi:hypothetical protein
MASLLDEVYLLKLIWIRDRAVTNSAFTSKRFLSNFFKIHLFIVLYALMEKEVNVIE